MLNWKLYAGFGLVILILFGWLQVTRANLKTAKLERDVAIEQRDTMFEINKQILAAKEKDDVLRRELYEDYKGARDETEKLQKTLGSHNLSDLAKNKPGLLTRYARRATDRVLQDIEAAANQDTTLPVDAGSGQGEPAPTSTDSNGDRR